jgi:hypothetical protein
MSETSKRRIMIATTALHQLGDISRDEPDFCIIYSEADDAYIGRWLEGLGFENVRFPKETTRDLTSEEQEMVDAKLKNPVRIIGI